MVSGAVLETGSMAGLMNTFGRHSRIMTNFSIFMAESRPFGPRGGLATGAGARVCGEGQWPSECPGDTVHHCSGIGWPWQYQCSRQAAGWVPGGYYTGYYPTHPTPGTPLPASDVSIPVHPVTARTCVLGRSKEILGVDNALGVSLGAARLT